MVHAKKKRNCPNPCSLSMLHAKKREVAQHSRRVAAMANRNLKTRSRYKRLPGKRFVKSLSSQPKGAMIP
ncbi:hypothetical protein ACFX2A_000147 [Malus domestica]